MRKKFLWVLFFIFFMSGVSHANDIEIEKLIGEENYKRHKSNADALRIDFDDVFRTPLSNPEEKKKLVAIFQSDVMIDVKVRALLVAYKKNPSLAGELVKLRPVEFWRADVREIETFISIAEFFQKKWDYSPAESIIAVVNDSKLADIYEKNGENGIIIWRSFVKTDSWIWWQKWQETLARWSIEMMIKKDLPMDQLTSAYCVVLAKFCDNLPTVLGDGLYEAVTGKPGLSLAILVVLIFLLIGPIERLFKIFSWFIKILLWPVRKLLGPRKPRPPKPDVIDD